MMSLITCLINHGEILASLLQEVKHKSNKSNDCHDKVKTTITELLRVFDSTLSTDLVETNSVSKVLQKIEETLQKFIQLDDEQTSVYAGLKKKVESKRQTEFSRGTSSTENSTHGSSFEYGLVLICSQQEDSEFQDAYQKLNKQGRECLFCFFMFSSASAEEVKKRELMHWWIGMDLIKDQFEGDEVLGKLVDEGLIDRVIGNKTIYNRYKMHQSVVELIGPKMSDDRSLWHQYTLEEDTILTSHTQHGDLNKIEPEKITGLLNVEMSNINPRTFDWISRMKTIKLLSLGIRGSPDLDDNRTEFEQVTSLKSALRRLRKVRCLSLQGISRLVVLPSGVYRLKNLMVLDLKACHDLMTIPKGIDSLYSLTHLDLSMCYMIDYIPKGVASLQNLVVFKGFVLNSDSEHTGLSCSFNDLSGLQVLRKLSIRTRRMDFPKKEDIETLHKMAELTNLEIVWVGRSSISIEKDRYSDVSVFPTKLNKIKLEAAPATIASQLLELISKQVSVEKVYVKGGRLWDFGPGRALKFVHVKFISLRYLHNLHIKWSNFQTTFPNLDRLEIFKCPNLIFFPCDCQNGIWECLE